MSNTPWSPARQSSGPVQTWVSSQWKFLPSQGQFSTAINILWLPCARGCQDPDSAPGDVPGCRGLLNVPVFFSGDTTLTEGRALGKCRRGRQAELVKELCVAGLVEKRVFLNSYLPAKYLFAGKWQGARVLASLIWVPSGSFAEAGELSFFQTFMAFNGEARCDGGLSTLSLSGRIDGRHAAGFSFTTPKRRYFSAPGYSALWPPMFILLQWKATRSWGKRTNRPSRAERRLTFTGRLRAKRPLVKVQTRGGAGRIPERRLSGTSSRCWPPLEEITRDDMLYFPQYWLERIISLSIWTGYLLIQGGLIETLPDQRRSS